MLSRVVTPTIFAIAAISLAHAQSVDIAILAHTAGRLISHELACKTGDNRLLKTAIAYDVLEKFGAAAKAAFEQLVDLEVARTPDLECNWESLASWRDSMKREEQRLRAQ